MKRRDEIKTASCCTKVHDDLLFTFNAENADNYVGRKKNREDLLEEANP